mmetsp:Transcript_118992/g.333292  ORF Transcript_118992/g.333292 Transcript_118992/m.333292 type:complete len:224 (-) Transcript_118992:193-864(-)
MSRTGLNAMLPSLSNLGTPFSWSLNNFRRPRGGVKPCKHCWKYIRYLLWDGKMSCLSLMFKHWQTSCKASTGCPKRPRKAMKQLRKTADREWPFKQWTTSTLPSSAASQHCADKHNSINISTGGAGKPRKATLTTSASNLLRSYLCSDMLKIIILCECLSFSNLASRSILSSAGNSITFNSGRTLMTVQPMSLNVFSNSAWTLPATFVAASAVAFIASFACST